MPNVIRFEIETDANYSVKEKTNLLDAFLAFIEEADPDVLEGTEEISIAPVGTPKATVITQEQKQGIIDELLQKATVSGGVTLSLDGETVLRAELNLI